MDSVNAQSIAVQLINLGCAKNLVDSEEMLGVLQREGFRIDTPGARADVVVVNTCGFIESAKRESIDAILGAVRRKESGDVGRVIVTGCLAQRYGEELARELPEVDAFLGAGRMDEIGRVVSESLPAHGPNAGLLRRQQVIRIPARPHHRWVNTPTRVRATAPWTAYLKISEGCGHRCTFCAIPSFRGAHVSKPLERVLQEAAMLAGQGVRELNLIAQDSTQYGYDLYGRARLPELLRELSQIDGIHWIRLFYCYPSRVNAAVIQAIASTPKVCPYIDMPLQHADEEVLRRMRRPGSAAAYLRLIARLRAASPDVAIRTTFIVGFPGETDAAFANLERFLEAAEFDRVGVFAYSAEDGTPAGAMRNQIPARVKQHRRNRLLSLQQGISLARNRRWVGREMEVLVENGGGRTFRDAPEIDGRVILHNRRAAPGEFIRARITEAREYDLVAS